MDGEHQSTLLLTRCAERASTFNGAVPSVVAVKMPMNAKKMAPGGPRMPCALALAPDGMMNSPIWAEPGTAFTNSSACAGATATAPATSEASATFSTMSRVPAGSFSDAVTAEVATGRLSGACAHVGTHARARCHVRTSPAHVRSCRAHNHPAAGWCALESTRSPPHTFATRLSGAAWNADAEPNSSASRPSFIVTSGRRRFRPNYLAFFGG